MNAPHHLQFAAQIDECNSPSDVIDVLALREFLAGTQPCSRSARLQRVKPTATLLPPGVEPSHVAQDTSHRNVLASGPGWTLRATLWRDRTAVVTVTATSEAVAAEILAAVTDDAGEPEPPHDGEVTIGFWHQTAREVRRVEREISVAPWDDIRSNYASDVAKALGRLVELEPRPDHGRLLLLHGPAGTGKTTALRALALAWRDWCQVDVVVDPERLLNDAAYLTHLMLGGDDLDTTEARWRMLVLEDCDELVRADAKRGTGQSLSRLLNLTDGFIGQGLDLLVCVTTNEPLDKLHPAIARPGRCLAEIHVGPFPAAEAAAWLGHPVGVGDAPLTLAELYARRGDVMKVERNEDAPSIGQYL